MHRYQQVTSPRSHEQGHSHIEGDLVRCEEVQHLCESETPGQGEERLVYGGRLVVRVVGAD